jgi:hypothetical protein
MDIPSYFIPRPPMPLDAATRDAFDALHEEVERAGGAELRYDLGAPIWQFLCYLTDSKEVVLHGSGDPAIAEFEPRKSNDVDEFGDRKAVYAASDGLWPMYFAIIDRPRVPMSLLNGAFRIADDAGALSEMHYFFSITEAALAARAFRAGTIYVLPRETFERQPPLGGGRVHTAQWASLEPVTPLARFTVAPEDFPLLGDIRGHDDEVTFARARARPDGFPWLD